jgi:hypothetical protein
MIYEYISRESPFSFNWIYFLPGMIAPPGLPTPLGIRDPAGLTILGGLAPLALLISGLADFTCLIDWFPLLRLSFKDWSSLTAFASLSKLLLLA